MTLNVIKIMNAQEELKDDRSTIELGPAEKEKIDQYKTLVKENAVKSKEMEEAYKKSSQRLKLREALQAHIERTKENSVDPWLISPTN